MVSKLLLLGSLCKAVRNTVGRHRLGRPTGWLVSCAMVRHMMQARKFSADRLAREPLLPFFAARQGAAIVADSRRTWQEKFGARDRQALDQARRSGFPA